MKQLRTILAICLSLSLCSLPLPASVFAEANEPAAAASEMPDPAPETTEFYDPTGNCKEYPTDVYHDPAEETTEFYDPTGNCKEYPSEVWDTTDPDAITGPVTICEDYDTSPMQAGEVRSIHFWNPETMTAGEARITNTYYGDRCFEVSYDKEQSTMRIKALCPGATSFQVWAEGCVKPVDISLSVSDPSVIHPTDVYHDPTEPMAVTETETETETETVPETQYETHVDCAPTMEYDDSPMKVGEERIIRFYNPETGNAEGAYVSQSGDECLVWDELDYMDNKEGAAKVKVRAVRAGEAHLSISVNGCPFIGHIWLTVEEAPETAEKQDPAEKLSLGKLNDDDAVNAKDGVLILQDAAYFGTHENSHLLTGEAQKNADVNGDGMINAADATCIFIYSAKCGTDPETPAFHTFMTKRLAEAQKDEPVLCYDISCSRGNYSSSSKQDTLTLMRSRDEMLAHYYQCQTAEEFRAYYAEQDAEQKAKIDNFQPAYDDAFFAEKNLIVMERDLSSGSIRLEVTGITAEADGSYTVQIKQYHPEVQTCDMASWNICLSVNKCIDDAEKISVNCERIYQA